MHWIILWTDYFVYLLFVMVIAFIVYVSLNKQIKTKFKQVFRRPLNVIAMMILGVYCIVGLMDSFHYQLDKGGIQSFLDQLLKPMIAHTERSYSAPFAAIGFTKESITLPNDTIVRDYPRLTYGGVHLQSLDQKGSDIKRRVGYIFLQSIIIWIALSVIILFLYTSKRQLSFETFFGQMIAGKTRFPWRTFLLNTGFILFWIIFIAQLMPYYHILGTDQVGEDVLYQTLKSIRTGLIIGTVTTMVMLPFAIIFGMMAGYFKHLIDDIIQYTYTTLSSIPGVLLIAAAVLTLQIVMDRNTD